MRSNLGTVSASSRRPETGFETMSTQLNDHTDRGMGGRQYGTSEDIETLQGENNASTSRFRAVEECGSSLARRAELRKNHTAMPSTSLSGALVPHRAFHATGLLDFA